jgi:hypothetical protein
MLEGRKAEERRHLAAAGCPIYRAEAHLDFRFGLLDVLGVRVARQILMRPGVGAKRHAGRDYQLGDLRMPGRVLAYLEEGGF